VREGGLPLVGGTVVSPGEPWSGATLVQPAEDVLRVTLVLDDRPLFDARREKDSRETIGVEFLRVGGVPRVLAWLLLDPGVLDGVAPLVGEYEEGGCPSWNQSRSKATYSSVSGRQ
jgi:hypothetical protein